MVTNEDNCWYRAKVLKRKDNKVEVFFVDYGNKDITTDDQLRETFEAHGKHRLEGHTRADNRPMQRLFARTPGWVLEGCFRQTWRDREAGIWRDALAYGLLAEDWRRGSETPLSQPLAG